MTKIVAFTLILLITTLYSLFYTSSSANTNTLVPLQKQQYVGPETCKSCHPEEYEEEVNTIHFYAFDDPIFQKVWESEGKPSFCLKCHTTGFDPETGSYAFPGVTCEVCHGPGMTMNFTVSSELCGKCHTDAHHPTFDEWLESGHSKTVSDQFRQCFQKCHELAKTGAPKLVEEFKTCVTAGCHSAELFLIGQGVISSEEPIYEDLNETIEAFIKNPVNASLNPVTCQTCHDPHQVGNKFQDIKMKLSVEVKEHYELCTKCHEVPTEFWEADSPHKIGGATCTTCHMATKPYEAEEPKSKWANTGHTFEVWRFENGTFAACTKCHDLRAQEIYINVINATGVKRYSELRSLYDNVKEHLTAVNKTLYELKAKGQPVNTYIEALKGLFNELDEAYYEIRELSHEGSNGLHNFALFMSKISSLSEKLNEIKGTATVLENLAKSVPTITVTTTKTETETTTETITTTKTKTTTETFSITLTETVTKKVPELTGYYLLAISIVIIIILIVLFLRRR